jgi:regulator of protease activity HflC (stomatin/prohibitin superfamily)
MALSMKHVAALGAAAAMAGLAIAASSWYTVDQTERGVLLRNGAIIGVAQPGLGFKVPLIDTVQKLSVKNELLRWEKLESYSHDQQAAHYIISVNYQINPDRVSQIYAEFGGAEGAVRRLVTPNVLKHSKIVIGQFTAQSTIQERAKLNALIAEAVQKAVEGPLTVTGVQVEDIKFSPAYEKSIEDRMLAEVEVLKLRQNAEREKVQAQITVTKASAEADATRAKAQASADATRVRGDAEASAIRARAAALADNPALVSLVQAERWDGHLPQTMVPGAAVPMIGLGQTAAK